jgi:serine/threonine-protein kinase ATR
MGSALDTLRQRKAEKFTEIINCLRLNVAKSLTANSVASLQSCHDDMLRLHALADVESIANAGTAGSNPSPDLLGALGRRLDVLGGYLADKQYLLGLRRAAMELAWVDLVAVSMILVNTFSRGNFANSDIASAWLSSAHLSRKGNFTSQAYHSMLNAALLKDRSATIEHAKLLWKDGHHRKAIQTLEGAISANEATPATSSSADSEAVSFLSSRGQNANVTAARV